MFDVVYVHELPPEDHAYPVEGWWHCDPNAAGEGVGAYVRVDALPDQIDIYRAIKKSGARSHADIAKVISDIYALRTPPTSTATGRRED